MAELGTGPGTQSEWWAANDPTGRSVREFRLFREASERPVTGALWSPTDGASTGPMVLFGHGASGDRYQAPICHLAGRLTRDRRHGRGVIRTDRPTPDCGPIEAAANIQVDTCSPNFLIQESIGRFDGFHAENLKEPIQWEDGYIIPPTRRAEPSRAFSSYRPVCEGCGVFTYRLG